MLLMQGSIQSFDTLSDRVVEHMPFSHVLSVPRFTIDHARSLAAFLVEGDGRERIYLVYAAVFAQEAAQVLLKSLEEPDEHTTLVFMTPYPYLLPQTIRSRMAIVAQSNSKQEESIGTREQMLTRIKNEFGSESDDDAATKRAHAVRLLDALEAHVRTNAIAAAHIYEAKHMLLYAQMPTKYVLEYAVSMVL